LNYKERVAVNSIPSKQGHRMHKNSNCPVVMDGCRLPRHLLVMGENLEID